MPLLHQLEARRRCLLLRIAHTQVFVGQPGELPGQGSGTRREAGLCAVSVCFSTTTHSTTVRNEHVGAGCQTDGCQGCVKCFSWTYLRPTNRPSRCQGRNFPITAQSNTQRQAAGLPSRASARSQRRLFAEAHVKIFYTAKKTHSLLIPPRGAHLWRLITATRKPITTELRLLPQKQPGQWVASHTPATLNSVAVCRPHVQQRGMTRIPKRSLHAHAQKHASRRSV